MKTIRFFVVSALLILLGTNAFPQSSYYYCNHNRIHLTENPFVRHIRLKTESVNDHKDSLRKKLCLYAKEMAFDADQYVYFVKDTNYITDFKNVVETYDSIISLNTCEYRLDSTTFLVPQRKVLVKLPCKTNLDSILRKLNIEYAFIKKDPYNNNCYTIVLEKDDALSTSVLLYNTGYFEYAEPDFQSSFQLLGYAENPYYSQQWSIHNDSININLLPAWEITTGSESIKTAIVDVGVNYYHEDLISNMLPGYSAISGLFGLEAGANNHPYESHGTYCAGIVAADNNNVGLVGVAHNTKLMSVKCADITPVGYRDINYYYPYGHDHIYTSHLLDALNKSCYELEADVILLALTNRFPSGAVYNKFSEVCENGRKGKGSVVVVSSGNNEMSDVTDTSMSFFAKHPDVISVGAVTPTGLRAVNAIIHDNYYFSSCYGDSLCVVAPGVHIPTTEVYSSYAYFSGTSAAASHVAGVAALVLSVNPCLTRDEVKFIIESTCTKIRTDTYSYNNCSDHPNGTWNVEVGYGLVNAGAAVSLAEQMGGYIYVNDTLISSTEIWDTIRFMNQDLTIDSSATLTITDSVLIANGARIIVRPGGKLIVDGGTLTSACTGEMWQGIFVEGHSNLHQTAANQGKVVLRNGAVIENALCGIRTIAPGDESNTSTGGIIIAENATFHNCARGVDMRPYTDYNPVTGLLKPNVSSFTRCTFALDPNHHFASCLASFSDHARLWGVKGVCFIGCTFNNTTSENSHGSGIRAEDAGFHVDTYCSRDIVNSDCSCPAAYATYSTFSGFATAINVSTSGSPFAVIVNEASFANNCKGVSVGGNNLATVTRCQFDLSTVPETTSLATGLELSACTGFLVEGNAFSRNSSTFPTYGIKVAGAGIPNNSLYRNTFSGLTYGIHASGDNGGGFSGLRFSCNTFSQNAHDIYVANGDVAESQGSASTGADNSFSSSATGNFEVMNPKFRLDYYYSTGGSHYPTVHTSNVLLHSNASANGCASTLCTGGDPIRGLPEYTALAVNAASAVCQNAGDTANRASLLQEMSDIASDNIRGIIGSDTLDVNALKDWFSAVDETWSKYSLAETEFLSGESNALTLQGVPALLETSGERDEYDNYMAFNALKEALSGYLHGHANWPSATATQIAELQNIADANTGRSSVMARGVLCFFFGICEDEDFTVMGDPRHFAATGENDISSHHQDVSMKLYPNPATNTLHVEFEGLDDPQGIITVADITGVVVQYVETSQRGVTIDVSHLTPGLYVISFRNKNGVTVRKFVKM